jgi:two-component sensor histidine kinase
MIVAGMPGVVFGAMEANRSFNAAIDQRRAAAEAVGDRVASRLDEVIAGGGQVLSTLARLSLGSTDRAQCQNIMQAAVDGAERYATAGRVGADGRLFCASRAEGQSSFAQQRWFGDLSRGATVSVSGLQLEPGAGESVLLVGAPIRNGSDFEGAVYLSLRRDWLATALRQETGRTVRGVAVFDAKGALIASISDGPDLLASLNGAPPDDAVESWIGGGALRVVVLPIQGRVVLGLRALLTVAAPLLAVALTALVVWGALQVWVLNWFQRLQGRVETGAPTAMTTLDGAPPEFRDLGDAFDRTMQSARERQAALAQAAEDNKALTRDLHHHVKNNLQVLISLLSRQQKRAGNDVARRAVAESRCRTLAIALVHRFLDPPEHLGVIDLDAYLAELARQAHATLFNNGRRARLLMEIDPAVAPVMRASTAGLILTEVLIAGAASDANDISIHIRWAELEGGVSELSVAMDVDGTSVPADPDADLIRQIARQAGADPVIGPGARLFARFAPPAPEGETRKSAAS